MTSGRAVLLNDLNNVIAVDSTLALSGNSLLDQHGAAARARLGWRRRGHAGAALLDDYVLVRAWTPADFADLVPGAASAAAGARRACVALTHHYLLFAGDGIATAEVGHCEQQPGNEQKAGNRAQDDADHSAGRRAGIQALV